MNVIIDTSVWSEYFRRKQTGKSQNINILKKLVEERRAVITGAVKQELLSGMREEARFDKLSKLLSGFPPLLATDEDHVLAAMFFNKCRTNGIQGSFADYLICAQSCNNRMSILSSDGDFKSYAKLLPIALWHNLS